MVKQKQLTKLAQEITGKEKLEEALGVVLKSYLEQRIAEYQEVAQRLEHKYDMCFEECAQKLGQELTLSWEHEKDYMDWEEAITNLQYFQEAAEQLKTYA